MATTCLEEEAATRMNAAQATQHPAAPLPQLHAEIERDALIACAAAVGPGGAIVEIGTGGGGTAYLLRSHAHPSVHVTSIDVRKTRESADGIEFLEGASAQVAEAWTRPIDFLFIDGGHRAGDLLSDFASWCRHLSPNARVAIHDYDEPIAGGVYYLGVKFVVDTLVQLGALTDVKQSLSLLTATVADPVCGANLGAAGLRDALEKDARVIQAVRDDVAEPLLQWLLKPGSVESRTFMERNAPRVTPAHLHHEPHPICNWFNLRMMCYVFDFWLKERPAEAFALAGIRDLNLFLEMMLWIDAERRRPYPTVCTYETILAREYYPNSLNGYALSTVEEISRFLTLEQVRLNMLNRVTNPIFDRVIAQY